MALHVAEAGSGDPIVLLHGWPQHWYAWRRVIPLLAGERRVICTDLRGFGWSDAPRSTYAKHEFADDLLRLLDALGLERVQLAGHDWGGYAGFLACLRAPERFSSYVAMSIVHPWPERRLAPKALAYAAAYQPLISMPVFGPLAQRFTPFYDAVFAAAGGERIWSKEERRIFAEPFREPPRAAAASRVYRTFLTRELAGLARGVYDNQRLSVPTRLLVGSDDPVVTVASTAGFEDHADDMQVIEVASGHFIPEEAPDAVAEHILALHAPGP